MTPEQRIEAVASLLRRHKVTSGHNWVDYSNWLEGKPSGEQVAVPSVTPKDIALLLGIDLTDARCICAWCEPPVEDDDDEARETSQPMKENRRGD